MEVFKTVAGLNTSFMANIFVPKLTNYNLRSANLLEIPKARSVANICHNRFYLPDDIKNETCVIKFKRKCLELEELGHLN